MAVQEYKQYARGTRAHVSEESFALGMRTAGAPLPAGASAELINYDYSGASETLSLVVRAGLRTSQLDVATGTPPTPFENPLITDARECHEANREVYSQVILSSVTDTLVPGTSLYQGKTRVMTGNLSSAIPPLEDIKIGGCTSEDATPGTKYTVFKKPTRAEIHGMAVQDLDPIARNVGTFAFNNGYYFFRRDSATNKGMLCFTKFDVNKYDIEEVELKDLTPKEAVSWGYNMLSPTPYTFTNLETAGTIQIQGILPYDNDGTLCMAPYINQPLNFTCFYRADKTKTYTIKWSWREASSTVWTELGSSTVTNLAAATIAFSSPLQYIMLKVEATVQGGSTPEQVSVVSFNFDKSAYGSTANIATKQYDLSLASGITYWKNRLVVYGLAEDPTVLIMSDVNDPGYFPYPNNVDLFDEPILYARAFLDQLLVFTSTRLYLITLSPDGLTWTKQNIQNNLHIQPWDIHLIQVVKNMVFFKSGNYYYMIVPRANSVTGELTIAPVSKNIEGLFDNFKTRVDTAFEVLYDYTDGLELIHYYNFLDFEDVHNVYIFANNEGKLYNYTLLYNTISRTWRSYIYESQSIYLPYKQDITRKGTLVGVVEYDGATAIQYFRFSTTLKKDLFVPNGYHLDENLNETYAALNPLPNYQYWDTGYREQNSDFKKRFRELQIRLNNSSRRSLSFYTDFYIDGDHRRISQRYVPHHNVDPDDPDYGLLTLEREFYNALTLPGETVLGEDSEDYNAWQLDVSAFPERYFWKIRIPISGKGYAPRMVLISFNSDAYEILNVAWVFRQLYAR